MISGVDLAVIDFCLEGFFFGKISVLCALTFTLAKKVQLSLGLGIYSGIFVMYLQCPSKESRTTIIVFYVLCLLYVLSVASVVSDSLGFILEVSKNSICKIIIMQMHISPQLQIDTVNDISHCYCPNCSKRFL